MTRVLTASTNIVSLTLGSFYRRYCCKYGIVLFALLVSGAISAAGPAHAQPGFSLIGTWQHTDQAGVTMLSFNQQGLFQATLDVPPGPTGQGSGRIQWRGRYKMTGATSWVAEVQSFQLCASGGGCSSCPRSPGDLPGGDACGLAQSMRVSPGVPEPRTFQPQGPNQFVDQFGQMWRRVR